MTVDEWSDIVDWIQDRFPDKPWRPEQVVAYYKDLQNHPASLVWTAIHHLYEQGQKFTPNGSQLVAETLSTRRREARDNMYRETPALPEPKSTVEWAAFSKKYYGKAMSIRETIEQIHRDKPCKNRSCSIHFDEEPADA